MTRSQNRRLSKTKAEHEVEVNLALTFWQETTRRPCRICGDTYQVEAHHVIPKSVLKRELRPCPPALLWAPQNGMALCKSHHERYTNRAIDIPRHLLTMANWEFARECDRLVGDERFTVRLERGYPEAEAA